MFIVLTFIFQGFVVVAYGPLNSDPHYVTSGSADTRALLGGLMELLLIAANLDGGCPVPDHQAAGGGLAGGGRPPAGIVPCSRLSGPLHLREAAGVPVRVQPLR